VRIIIKGIAAVVAILVIAFAVAIWRLYVLLPRLPAQQLFINGQVITMDSKNRVEEALLIEGDTIVAVGNTENIRKLSGKEAIVHDLKGHTLLPGFIDAHGHFPGTGLSAKGIDLTSPPAGDILELADIQEKLLDAHKKDDNDQWLFGFGYDDTLLSEKRHPNRFDLDSVSVQRPIFLLHSSGHLAVTNTAGLRKAGITSATPNPKGGEIVKDANGNPTGLLLEHAVDLVAPLAMDFGFFDFVAMADLAAKQYLSVGVTTAQSGGVDPRFLRGLKLLSTLGRIPQRLWVWPLVDKSRASLESGELLPGSYQSDRFSIKAVKLIADGSIQGYTAHLNLPYHRHENPDFKGFPRISEDDLNAEMKKYHCMGFQIAIHGNGDASIDSIIGAFANAQSACPRKDPRAIVVHAQMASHEQLKKMKNLGMTPSFFVAHTFYWGDRHREQFLGPQRADRISPLKEALEEDLRFTIHLDAPVVPMDMARLLWTAVNRETRSGRVLGKAQRIEPLQALRAVTIDAAWQSFEEERLGSLEPGKQADLVLVDRDPLKGGDSLLNMNVERVWIAGRCVFQRGNKNCATNN